MNCPSRALFDAQGAIPRFLPSHDQGQRHHHPQLSSDIARRTKTGNPPQFWILHISGGRGRRAPQIAFPFADLIIVAPNDTCGVKIENVLRNERQSGEGKRATNCCR